MNFTRSWIVCAALIVTAAIACAAYSQEKNTAGAGHGIVSFGRPEMESNHKGL